MAGDPFGLPGDLARELNAGHYRQFFQKGAQRFANDVATKGRRIVEPVKQMLKSSLQKEGMAEEFIESAELLEEMEAAEASAELAGAALTASRALAIGWGALAGSATGVTELVVCVAAVGLLLTLVMGVTAKPAVAEPLKRDYRAIKRTLPHPLILPRFPAGAVSDARLKHAIKLITTALHRPNLYEFSYLGSQDRFVGVMAQELLADARFRHLVLRHRSGYLAVDYGPLAVPQDVAAMQAAGEICLRAHVPAKLSAGRVALI